MNKIGIYVPIFKIIHTDEKAQINSFNVTFRKLY